MKALYRIQKHSVPDHFDLHIWDDLGETTLLCVPRERIEFELDAYDAIESTTQKALREAFGIGA